MDGFEEKILEKIKEDVIKLHQILDVSELESNIEAKRVNIDDLKIRYFTGLESDFSRNRILFGAPGTGKSFEMKKDSTILFGNDNENDLERVTFHPDYSYANFVGTYKPVPYKNEEGEDAITYEYVPGPFMRILVKALQNSRTNISKPYLLIIEEINRANVAAVFGDVFQLLDRGENEVSEYSINTSKDMREFLAKEENLGGHPNLYEKIKLPDNLFIWATMNSADQGVFPMDTAFKRRWDFQYLGINDNDEDIKGKYVTLGTGKYNREVEWNKLRMIINDTLSSSTYKINEDKLLGPYFLSRKIIVPKDGNEISSSDFIKVFKNKVLMYLFEDAVKQKRNSLFKGCGEPLLYSSICNEFEKKGVFIFCTEISDLFPKIESENSLEVEGK